MSTVKTAISLEKGLFKAADALAEELRISRSRLVALAVEEFVRRHENKKLLDRINEACEGEPDEEDRARVRGMRRHHRSVLESER